MIYCVEDDESIRDLEVYALRATGMEAEGFADGASFLAALEKRTPDLAVLDVMLPGGRSTIKYRGWTGARTTT